MTHSLVTRHIFAITNIEGQSSEIIGDSKVELLSKKGTKREGEKKERTGMIIINRSTVLITTRNTMKEIFVLANTQNDNQSVI